ncbi:MAG: DUF4908 domain-containing protein [Myxococcota bacterium]
MNERHEALLQLVAKSVDTVLQDLVDLRRRARKGEKVTVPLVTLHLRGGRDLTGWIVDAGEDPRHGAALVFHIPGRDFRNPDDDACYLPPAAVEAITVHGAGGHALALEQGRPAPSQLELDQRANELSRRVSRAAGRDVVFSVDWDATPDHGEPVKVMEDIMRMTAAVLEDLSAEPVGRQAVAAKVRAVRFGQGPNARVALDGETLMVIVPVNSTGEGRLSNLDLRRAVESLL